MSTNDVPGIKDKKTGKSKHNDALAMGCWAEHDDGSLIFVESTENGRVIYSMFDVQDPEHPVEYRDAMNVRAFEKAFSYDAKKTDSIKWTWHDKTPFPWDRIIELGSKDGVRFASADHLLSAAERVARSRGLRAGVLNPDDYAHRSQQVGQGAARTIRDRIQGAINELRR